MTEIYQYYNMFDPEGRLLQVEYALEALNNSNPVVIASNRNLIVCSFKKKYASKLVESKPQNLFKISPNIYALVTGLDGDIDQVILKSKNICSSNSLNLGFSITPDILCRAFSDKIQKLIQSTGQRALAFGIAFLGFENGVPLIYATDTSATFYSYYGYSFGTNSEKINNFLVKNLQSRDIPNERLLEITLRALLESIGEETPPDQIHIAILDKEKNLVYLDDSEKDLLLQKIADI